MQKPALLVIFLCFTLLALAAPAKRRRSPSAKSPAKSSAAKSPARNKAGAASKKAGAASPARHRKSGKAGAHAKAAKSTKSSRSAGWRAGQQQPARERYQEIQQALIGKGYGAGDATGIWGPEWASALKRYQGDQSLEPTGKLDALSLISLGLGPKRETPASNGVLRGGALTAPGGAGALTKTEPQP